MQALQSFQVSYIRALGKVGRPLENAFFEAVGQNLAVEAERLWRQEHERAEALKQQSQQHNTAPARFHVRASLRGQYAIAAMIDGDMA